MTFGVSGKYDWRRRLRGGGSGDYCQPFRARASALWTCLRELSLLMHTALTTDSEREIYSPSTKYNGQRQVVREGYHPSCWPRLTNKCNHKTFANKAIVGYTSPALCTPVTPFPPIGDAAYRQPIGGGPSHGHRQHAEKFGKDRAGGSGDILADRQTDRHTHTRTTHRHRQTYMTILRNRSGGRSKNKFTISKFNNQTYGKVTLRPIWLAFRN